jgi:hypothetical protein
MEIVANDDVTDAQSGNQNPLDKGIGRQTGERQIERHDCRHIHAVTAQEREFLINRGQLKMRAFWLEDRARMRFEYHHTRTTRLAACRLIEPRGMTRRCE